MLFAVLVAPEIGRMIDFRSFETFAPNGPGLGNLFGQISPFEALGIWPSGDFRLAPGDGAVPALGYYLGAAFAAILLVYGLVLCWRRRETAIVSAVCSPRRWPMSPLASAARPTRPPRRSRSRAPLAALTHRLAAECADPSPVLYLLAAGACSLLALANAPVGPTSYTPALTELRPLVASGSTLVLASRRAARRPARRSLHRLGAARRPGLHQGRARKPGSAAAGGALRRRRRARPRARPSRAFGCAGSRAPYVLWERTGPLRGTSPCPLIAVRQARQGARPRDANSRHRHCDAGSA